MNILLIGGSGQVGRVFIEEASKNFEEFSIDSLNRSDFDLSNNTESINKIISKKSYDLVLNFSGFTNVDLAEDNSDEAFQVNAIAVTNIAKACFLHNLPFIHLSTDYIFSGEGNIPYIETDQPNPINTYGKSKLAGEIGIQENMEKYIILRTSWVFSDDRNCFLAKIIELGKKTNSLKIVSDQIGGPTSAFCLVSVLLHLCLEFKTKGELKWGIYHFSGMPFVSWADFAKEFFNQSQTYLGREITITPCESSEFKSRAKRPKNSCLNNELINKTFDLGSCEWKKELSRYLHKLFDSQKRGKI